MNNNTANPSHKSVKRRRSRFIAPLSERLSTARSYPRFGSSALTGVLR